MERIWNIGGKKLDVGQRNISLDEAMLVLEEIFVTVGWLVA